MSIGTGLPKNVTLEKGQVLASRATVRNLVWKGWRWEATPKWGRSGRNCTMSEGCFVQGMKVV
jgi:hypothetical protein